MYVYFSIFMLNLHILCNLGVYLHALLRCKFLNLLPLLTGFFEQKYHFLAYLAKSEFLAYFCSKNR